MSESEDVSVGVSQLTEARMWLLSKCRSVCGSVQNAMDKGRRSDTNRASQLRSGMQSLVITPTSIPPFIIPSPENLKNRACNEDAGISTSSDSVSCSDQLSPEDGAALQVQMNRWNKSCHSEPVSPVKQPTPVSVFRRCHAISYDMLDEAPKRTNADPLSLPALSLPHLKTKTKFGFETLFESPNTNRKESLFHGNNFQARRSSLFTHGPPEPRNPEYNSAEMLNNISGTDSCMEPITRSRTRRQDVLWHVAPLGVPLVLAPTEKSEATKRSSSTSPYMIRGRTKRSIKNTVEENISDDESPQSSLHHVIRRRRRRRRQSVGGHVANKDSDTAAGSEEESSDDMMSSQRRHSSCDIHLEPSQIERLLLLSAMTSTSGAPPPPSSLLESESSSRLVNCRPVAAEGELKFVMKYHPRTRQLSVRLLRGYNIGGQHNCDMTTSPFVKLSLFPGKLQQCRTNIVKHTKNPVFNKCFYFNDIDVRQLRCTYLHMKVMNRVYQLKRDEHLGDIQVNLADADLLSEEEQKMRRELQPVLKELGRINVSLCFHAREERLDVQVLDMTELPCNGITGLPDPYVQIELGQPGRSYCTVHTKTKRKTTTATFNESFTFPMSPKIEDLNDTSLTFTVLDRETIRTDSIIGRVRLGYAATEECEFEHWNKVLQTPGKEFNKWHVLMED